MLGAFLYPLGKGDELTHLAEAQSKAAAFPHSEGSAEVAWASAPHASWTDASQERCSRHISMGGGPGEDPVHVGEAMSPTWPGYALASRLRAGRCEQGQRSPDKR